MDYKLMKALSKRERVEILSFFIDGVTSPKEISMKLDSDLSTISYHTTVLRNAGLIVIDREEPRRGAVEHFYRATVQTLVPPDTWENLPPGLRKGVSIAVIQEFFEDVSFSLDAELFDKPPGELSWTPMILDQLAIGQVGQITREYLDTLMEIQAEASKRLSEGDEDVREISASVFLASFLSARDPAEGKKASARKKR